MVPDAIRSQVASISRVYEYADCKRIDKDNGNNFWIYALKKEMKDVGIAFKILEEDEHLPVEYKKVKWIYYIHSQDGFHSQGYMG